MPQLNIRPPSPDSLLASAKVPITVDCATAGAGITVRYTTDGSRPTALSPVVPPHGAVFTWPGPSFPFNVRAFDASGKLLPSITNGAIVERANYRPRTGPAAGNDLPLKTRWESITASAGGVSVSGWVVDPALVGGGLASVEVEIYIDYRYAHARVCTRSCR
jgi:hypothetical protein